MKQISLAAFITALRIHLSEDGSGGSAAGNQKRKVRLRSRFSGFYPKLNFKYLWIAFFIIILTAGDPGWSREKKISHVYTTWENMEIDKCASAWLLKFFIDKNAQFQFFPKGGLIKQGIPFDVPQAEIRRYHQLSTFEYLMKKYEINDPALNRMAEVIHDIEINFWGKKKVAVSEKINTQVREIIDKAPSPETCMENCFDFFDQLYNFYSGDICLEK